MSDNKLTHEQIMALQGKDQKAFRAGMNDYFTDITTLVCKRIIDENEIPLKIAPFMIDEGEVRGDGVESIVWPSLKPMKVEAKNCCLTECDKCKVEPKAHVLPNLDWMRLCAEFSYKQLYTSFCNQDDLARLANALMVAMANGRREWMDNQAEKLLSDKNNFFINGVKGGQIKTSTPAKTLYRIIIEMINGTNKYNSISKKWKTRIEDIVIISNVNGYENLADDLSKRCQPLFNNCANPVSCNQLTWITMDLEDNDFVILDKRKLKVWEVFVEIDNEYLKYSMKTAFYEQFMVGVANDDFYNGIGVKIVPESDDQKNADEIATTINAVSGVDLTVTPTANTQAEAETAVKALIDSKVTDKKGLTLDYTFSNYKAATDTDTNGSIDVVVSIKKGDDSLASSDKKTFVLKFKEASPVKKGKVV